MFIILNRHKEILAHGGEFYPSESVGLRRQGVRLFASRPEAEQYAKTIREYTKVEEQVLS